MAIHTNTTSRRRLLTAVAGAPALSLPAAAGAEDNPDAEMIAEIEAFLRFHSEKEEALRPQRKLLDAQWTEEQRALDAAAGPEVTGYHEDLGEIAEWQPATREGLAAKAKVVLWHFKYPSDNEEFLVLGLAGELLRMAGEPIPAWADVG